MDGAWLPSHLAAAIDREQDLADILSPMTTASGLGCLGEININEQGDEYGKWAIRILVSFRDGEALTELTHQRQSGGERSLTTILYLISLLELSQVPFSMVDEINQGMDGRAERAIHNHLVHAVCEKPNQGQ